LWGLLLLRPSLGRTHSRERAKGALQPLLGQAGHLTGARISRLAGGDLSSTTTKATKHATEGRAS
jgi:hypothetical protein